MKRVCVLGNSHVGALVEAWDGPAKVPGLELTFFADRRLRMEGMVVRNGCLAPSNGKLRRSVSFTSGGLEKIVPDAYDAFLLYGLGLTAYPELPGFYSAQVRALALSDHAKAGISHRLLLRLREITGKPAFVAHTPLPACRSKDYEDSHPAAYLEGVDALNEVVFRDLAAKLVPQPLATVVNGFETRPDFARGSRLLSIGDDVSGNEHPKHDTWHMNADFGARFLADFVPLVQAD